MATQQDINRIIMQGQAYLWARVRQLQAELYGETLEIEPLMAEWAEETARQLEELTDGSQDNNS